MNPKNPSLFNIVIIVAAVARKLVPNCSAPMVTNMAQKPVLKPIAVQMAYMLLSLLFNGEKNKMIEIMDRP